MEEYEEAEEDGLRWSALSKSTQKRLGEEGELRLCAELKFPAIFASLLIWML